MMQKTGLEWVAFPQWDVAVVVPRGVKHGSLASERLHHLENHLIRLADETSMKHLVLDLTSLEVLGAGFLGMLVRLHRRLRKCGKSFLVIAHCEPLDLISSTCLDRLFPVFSTLGEARLDFTEDRSGWCPVSV